jgi:class 3 adenylate cyclase
MSSPCAGPPPVAGAPEGETLAGWRVTIGVKIFAIAAGLLALMAVVALLSLNLARDVGKQLDYVINDYIPGYGALARASVRSVEQGLYLRRLVIGYLQTPPDTASIDVDRRVFAEKGRATDLELAAARKEIGERLADPGRFTDVVALARLDTRIELMGVERQRYEQEAAATLAALEARDLVTFQRTLATVDRMRDELDARIDAARTEMLRLAEGAATNTRLRQNQVIRVSVVVMTIAGILGLLATGFISFSLARPVRRLLAGTKAVEAGALDTVVPVTSGDEIGVLTTAFNEMVAQLRVKERIRETFGKYMDPRIVEGLIDRPALTGAAGERRVMTVFFCDMKGFTSISEGLTPTGLVNVINHYLTTMSAPIRQHNGIIDKYVGDAIMAFWGPPFSTAEEQARLACLAGLDQLARLTPFRAELPELMGIRRGVPEINMRIGIATGETVVGNIGSDVIKSYTVMGDTVNLASRLEGASKAYDTRLLVDETTVTQAGDAIEAREIDSILVVGKTEPNRIFEVLGRKGELDAARSALRDHFAAGLAAYRGQAWPEATAQFEACLTAVPGDGPARVFLERVAHLSRHAPGPDWNGVWTLTEK